jgi:hypothetical protein
MPKQELDSSKVSGPPIDEHRLCSAQRMRTELGRIETDTGDPLKNQASVLPRCQATSVATTCEKELARLPSSQAQIIHCDFYRTLGGFRPLPLMEDVDLVRRIGRRRLIALPIAARTSAARWLQGGWLRRSSRNLTCLSLFLLGVPPRLIARLYG